MSSPPGISSFIPGTTLQFAWDSTSLGYLKRCPRLYQLTIVEGWRRKGNHGSVHLDFGGWYHSALELYDRLRAEGQGHEDALQDVVHETLLWTWTDREMEQREDGPSDQEVAGTGRPWDSEHNLKTRGTLVRSVVWYLEQFRDDPAKTIILANGKPAVELSFRMETEWFPTVDRKVVLDNGLSATETRNWDSPYILCGHLDRVVEFCGANYVMDRKTTTTTISANFFSAYNPDNQMSLYTLASRVIYQSPVKGVIIDGAQIAVGFSRFERGFTYRTESQTEEWLDNTREWLRLNEAFSAADFWPMNDTACHQYGGCTFRGICSKSPEVRQQFLETDFETRFWNPLIAR